jgi:predicted metal-binding protein
MARFKHILFVCQNERDRDNPKGSCKHRGSAALLDRLKELASEHGQKGKVRITGSGCLDLCAKGCAVAAFSGGAPAAETWYGNLGPEDADALFEAHILGGERLTKRVVG